jgi:hypothetical protein
MVSRPWNLKTGNWKRASDMVRWVILHAVPYIRKSLRLENTQENLQSRMPGSESERRGRFFDGLGSNIVVQYSVGPIITLRGPNTAREYVDGLDNQVHPIILPLFSNNDAVFQDDNAPTHSHGLKSVQVNFTIFPSQHTQDFNIIDPLWSVLETGVRNRFPSPTCLKPH